MDEPGEIQENKPLEISRVELSTPEASRVSKPAWHWLRSILACNPFYIFSAALLLYGLFRVSNDSRILGKETAHLIFNFSSLQFYEALLAATAIFLARRQIWYDCTLLVALENMLALVPFILISQASLIDTRFVWVICAVGGTLAILRFGSLKQFISELNLPARLVIIGFVILAVNVTLPIIYRILHESKVGTKPDWGAAYYMNQYAWYAVLTAICALGNFVPFSRRDDGPLPARGWVPIGFYILWLIGSGVNLYCLGYVYDFNLRPDLLAPAVWMVCWIGYKRIPGFLPEINPRVARLLMVLAALATLLALSQAGHKVFFALTILNAALYKRIYFRNHEERLALHLLLISLAAIVAALPSQWASSFVGQLSRGDLIVVGVVGYVLICIALSPNPKPGIVGGLVTAIAAAMLLRADENYLHWGTESGIAFMVAHSLRWCDGEHAAAKGLRFVLCFIWLSHSLWWMHGDGFAWMSCVIAGPVLLVYLILRVVTGFWGPRAVPIAGVLVVLSGTVNSLFEKIESAPPGVAALMSSFALFGLGTLMAVTRHRWNKTA